MKVVLVEIRTLFVTVRETLEFKRLRKDLWQDH